jgi:hypothetical protein
MKRMRPVAITVTTAIALIPMPAHAANSAEQSLSILETVGIFVLAPLSIYGVIWLLWSIPQWRREGSASTAGKHGNPRPGE